MKKINFIHFSINDIQISNNSLFINYSIDLASFELTVPFDKSFFIPSSKLKGLLFQITIFQKNYDVFITSTKISKILTKNGFKNIDEYYNYERGWLVEFVKKFNGYKIYFFRSFKYRELFENGWMGNLNIYNKDFIFKGFYHTDPTQKLDVKKFMHIGFPLGYSVLVQIEKHRVKSTDINYYFDILIGEFKYFNIEAYAYIIHLKDLISIQTNNGFKKSIFIKFDDYLLPIPSITQFISPEPVINSQSSISSVSPLNRLCAYTAFISRSQVLSIFIKPDSVFKNSLGEQAMELFDNDKLIKLWQQYEYRDLIGFDKKIDKSFFISNNLVYSLGYDASSLGFFEEIYDYDDYRNYIEDRNAEILSRQDLPTWEDQIWDDLDWSEKYAMNATRADNEFENKSFDHTDYLDQQFSEEKKYFKLSIDNRSNHNINNIFCVFFNNEFAIFEIIREKHYQRIFSPLVLNPFIQNLTSYSGILNFRSVGEIQFSIIQRCSIKKLKKFLNEIMGYEKYHILISYDYYICFNLKIRRNFIFFEDIFEVKNPPIQDSKIKIDPNAPAPF